MIARFRTILPPLSPHNDFKNSTLKPLKLFLWCSEPQKEANQNPTQQRVQLLIPRPRLSSTSNPSRNPRPPPQETPRTCPGSSGTAWGDGTSASSPLPHWPEIWWRMSTTRGIGWLAWWTWFDLEISYKLHGEIAKIPTLTIISNHVCKAFLHLVWEWSLYWSWSKTLCELWYDMKWPQMTCKLSPFRRCFLVSKTTNWEVTPQK